MKEQVEALIGKERCNFNDLRTIMEILRGEGGCPWDREQTHESIRSDFIEETYEVIEAIDNADPVLLREELGDVLLQVVFHARMEEEKGTFDIDDVANDICKKLILRHPHIFADVKAETSDEVLKNWDAIKSVEKQRKTVTQSLESIPPALPALMRADKAGRKAAKVGFDFASFEEAAEKLTEETEELRRAVSAGDTANAEEELGDLLFSAVNCARKLGINSEMALNSATEKFIRRFSRVEENVISSGRDVSDLQMDELDRIWESVKD